MAAAALRSLCGCAPLAPAFVAGEAPLLPSLLAALPAALDAAPPAEPQLLAIHEALAHCVASARGSGALPPLEARRALPPRLPSS